MPEQFRPTHNAILATLNPTIRADLEGTVASLVITDALISVVYEDDQIMTPKQIRERLIDAIAGFLHAIPPSKLNEQSDIGRCLASAMTSLTICTTHMAAAIRKADVKQMKAEAAGAN